MIGVGGATAGAEESTKIASVTYTLTEGWRSVRLGWTDSVDRGLLITVAPAEAIMSLVRARPASTLAACLLSGTGEGVTLPDAGADGDRWKTASVCTTQPWRV